MSNFLPVVDRIRIIPRPADFLSRNVGDSGEVYFNRETNSLRVYSGDDPGGFEIARSDLSNVDQNTLIEKIGDVDLSGLGGRVIVSDTVPTEVENGDLWFNTNNATIFIFYQDSNSSQWVQPSLNSFVNISEINFPNNPSLNENFEINGVVWQWDGTVWKITIAETEAVNIFSTIQVDGQPSISALNNNDVLNFAAGSNVTIATDATTNTITINSTGTTSGSEQNVFTSINADTGTLTASSSSDFVNITGGTGITTTVIDNTIQIDPTNILRSFNNNVEAQSTGLTIDKIYEPAITMFRVNNISTQAYTFEPHYSAENPNIFALSGTTIAFDLSNIGGHPFAIQDPFGSLYNTGVVHVSTEGVVSTGAAAQGKESGTLYWRIPEELSGTYRYQCLSHAQMVGGINIKRFTAI